MAEPLPVFDRLSDYTAHYARTQPDLDAIVWTSGRCRWSSLHAASLSAAAAMAAAGLAAGDRIAVLSPPRPEVVVSFLAALALPAIWLGLNPSHAPAEILRTVRDAKPKLILVAPAWRGRDLASLADGLAAAADGARVVMLPDTADLTTFVADIAPRHAAPSDFVPAQPDPAAPAILVYTSGMTGEPKGALLPGMATTLCSRVQHAHWGARLGRTRLINPFPIGHVAFVLDATCLILVSGGCMILQEGFDPAAYLAAIATERANVLALVPTMYLMLLQHPAFATTDLSSVEVAAFGGAGASPDLVRQLSSSFPRVSGAYGSTETAGQVLFSAETDSPDQIAASLGRPVADYALRLATDAGVAPVPGAPGEIQVREPFVLSSYWNDAGTTRAAFTDDGWLRTGDLAVAHPDGTWRLVGRASQAFKSGGYNVSPREIELRLEAHVDVAVAAVVAAPDPLFGEVGIAFVEPSAGAVPDPTALSDWCRQELANYKIPKRFVVRPSLPRLAVGKVDRAALTRAAATLVSSSIQEIGISAARS